MEGKRKYRVVHYLNQFFGGIGGEDRADLPPLAREGPVGPGLLFEKTFGGAAQIVATVLCGDNYFNEHIEEATASVIGLIQRYEPDLVLAGPAFNAGRYGFACGAVCQASMAAGLKALTGMYPENPGVEVYRRSVFIVPTKATGAGMAEAVPAMVRLALRLLEGPLGPAREEGYLPRGLRRNYFSPDRGAKRAVDMLVAKLKGEFQTEYAMPLFDKAEPLPPIADLSRITLALVTSGGIVPKGNPDRIESSSASKYGRYPLEGALSLQSHQTVHGGYDPTYANQDPNRVLPLDVVRELEEEGRIGKLYPYYYATVGNGTSVATARMLAQAIAQDLVRDGVGAVIITST